MKLVFAALIALCIVAYISAVIEVLPEEEPIGIFPRKSYGKTRYDLITCHGCKLVMLCTFMVDLPGYANITVSNGFYTVERSPQPTQSFIETSLHNEMTVIFNNQYPIMTANCQVHATKPFMDIIEPKIDSREHGLISKGRKKNTCKCGWTNKSPGRIVGGTDASVNEYSFPVLLRLTKDGMFFCGGSVITAYHVLTAAHCTHPVKNESITVVVGDHDVSNALETQYTSEHLVKRVFQHIRYDPNLLTYDISILEVASKIIFNDVIGPVCLPRKQFNLQDKFIKIMGWGMTANPNKKGNVSTTLKKVNIKVIDPEICESVFFTFRYDRQNQICTYNYMKGVCNGDSGGPLVHLNPETNTYYQVGVISYSKLCGTTDPTVHTDVGHFLPWIKEQISRSNVDAELCY